MHSRRRAGQQQQFLLLLHPDHRILNPRMGLPPAFPPSPAVKFSIRKRLLANEVCSKAMLPADTLITSLIYYIYTAALHVYYHLPTKMRFPRSLDPNLAVISGTL